MTTIPIRLRGETLPMTTELLDRYNVQGPRYTSYPTAPEWTETIGPAGSHWGPSTTATIGVPSAAISAENGNVSAASAVTARM